MKEFSKEVKVALVMAGLTQTKLAEMVAEKCGIKSDVKYVNHVILGKKKSAPVKAAICEILELEAE